MVQPGQPPPSAVRPSPVRRIASIEVALLYPDGIGASTWNRVERSIAPEEKEKAGRLVFLEDRQACLAAHWLKRLALTRAVPIRDPMSWRFGHGFHGKPHVLGNDDIHFNLSHCHGLVACAVRHGAPVGLDVEFTGNKAPPEIVEHYFSEREANWWRAQRNADKDRAFFGLWTAKEAFIKATGRGLSQQFPTFDFAASMLKLLPQGDWRDDAHLWRLEQSKLEGPHALATAWRDCGRLDETVCLTIIEPEAWLQWMAP